MNQIDRNKILKMLATLLLLLAAVGAATQVHKKNSMTLDEYAKLHPEQGAGSDAPAGEGSSAPMDEDDSRADGAGENRDGETRDGAGENRDGETGDGAGETTCPSALTGAMLNGGPDGQAMIAERVTYAPTPGTVAEAFYFEPLSENLRRYITGISYPLTDAESAAPEITYEDLRYVHVLHYDFEGNPAEGELICNVSIAEDLLDIFYELYRNEYQLEKVRLIDEYDGDDDASMADNNTSCFNYRLVEGANHLSKHALGLALDVNPYYNPYVTYDKDGNAKISPEGAESYADRTMNFPYKIDEDDLCYKLFVKRGFTWGGNWNSSKDYQHFQKAQ